MTALYGQVVNSSGFRPYLQGYYLEESVEFAGVIDVRPRIFYDYYSVTPTAPENIFLSAVVSPIVFITSYDELVVKSFPGNPPRRKFGSLTTLHENLIGDYQYIQYEAQTFTSRLSLINPTPLGFPSDMSALPAFEQFSNILLATLNTPSYPLTNMEPWLGISALGFDLEPTVIANIGFSYMCYANYSLPAPSTLLIYEV